MTNWRVWQKCLSSGERTVDLVSVDTEVISQQGPKLQVRKRGTHLEDLHHRDAGTGSHRCQEGS